MKFPLIAFFLLSVTNIANAVSDQYINLDINGRVVKSGLLIKEDNLEEHEKKEIVTSNFIKNIIANDINSSISVYAVQDLREYLIDYGINKSEEAFQVIKEQLNDKDYAVVLLSAVNIKHTLSLNINLMKNNLIVKYILSDGRDIIDSKKYIGPYENARVLAHIIASNIIYMISGYNPYFDSKILFVTDQKFNRKLAIVDRDGFGFTQVGDSNSSYSPVFLDSEKKKICYIDNSLGVPKLKFMDFGTWKTYSALPDSKLFQKVMSPRIGVRNSQILFVSMEDNDVMNIYKLDSENNNLVTKEATFKNAIILSPGEKITEEKSKEMFYSKSSPSGKQIYKLTKSLFGLAEKKISKNSGSYFDSVLSPDGSWVVFTKIEKSKFHIGVMRDDGSQERLLFSAYHLSKASWNKNSFEFIFSFKEHKKDKSKLMIMDILGNQVATIKSPDDMQDFIEPHWFHTQNLSVKQIDNIGYHNTIEISD